jgi:hypothetical protein
MKPAHGMTRSRYVYVPTDVRLTDLMYCPMHAWPGPFGHAACSPGVMHVQAAVKISSVAACACSERSKPQPAAAEGPNPLL